jgi:hypothetical protein
VALDLTLSKPHQQLAAVVDRAEQPAAMVL